MDQKYRLDLGALSTEKPACLLHELKDYMGARAIGPIADPLTSCVGLSHKRAGDLQSLLKITTCKVPASMQAVSIQTTANFLQEICELLL